MAGSAFLSYFVGLVFRAMGASVRVEDMIYILVRKRLESDGALK
jgi:hypothetical protein